MQQGRFGSSAATASLVVPTFNRRSELRELLCSAQKQTASLEIIVMDDGSTDGTAEMMRDEFPGISYERFAGPNGPSFLRNRGAQRTDATILFFLDDDSVLTSPRTIEQTLAEFDHPRVGAVAIPFIMGQSGEVLHQHAPGNGNQIYVCAAFIGAAHAIRREIFLRLGGYRERFFYMGEEGDYCIRMLAAGYVTRLGRADPICHYESPRRSSERMDFYGRRNDILFVWQNVPMPYLPFHLAATVVRGSIYTVRSARHPQKMFAGMFSGLAECFRGNFERRPVDPRIYRLSRELKKRGPLPLARVIDRLPAPAGNQI